MLLCLLYLSPKRYQLSELVDWFFRVMRRDEEWGYRRTDLRFSPLFQMRISATQKFCPSWPLGLLGWDKIERVNSKQKVQTKQRVIINEGVFLNELYFSL